MRTPSSSDGGLFLSSLLECFPASGSRYLMILWSDFRLVDIAPAPILSRFEGLDDRVPAVVEMLPRMPMRRGVAAADVTAGQAQAQMHPPRPNSQAILAALGARDDVADHVQMRVGHCLH